MSFNIVNILFSYIDGMSERLRRWASVPFGYAIGGSNPPAVVISSHCI